MLFALVLLSCALSLSLAATPAPTASVPQPYCDFNETVVTTTPVLKMRYDEKTEKRGWKFWKKPPTTRVAEQYYENVETRQFKLVRRCCDGYALSAMKVCEPVCAAGCPQDARCVEPNRCQCRTGYMPVVSPHDGTHHCQPICQPGCPAHTHCAAPDVCECERGYRVHDGQCLAHCSAACPSPDREECVRPEVCECRSGYVRDADTQLCMEAPEGEAVMTTEETSTEEQSTSTDWEGDRPPVIAEDSAELDENEKIFLTTQRTLIIISGEDSSVESESMDSDSGESASTEISPPRGSCDAGHFSYRGECRPMQFANEPHCRFRPCGSNAQCLANGTCACSEGYFWHRRASLPAEGTDGVVATALCISEPELNALLAGPAEEEASGGNRWLVASFTTLGVLCLVGALVFLGVKYARRQHDSMDLKNKNDLLCKYEQTVA